MKKQLIFILPFLLLTSQASGKENKCPTWPTYYEPEPCYCDEQLNNLEITLPKGMKVMSACLYDPSRPQGGLIDLNKEKVSLDKYRNGSIPYGTIFLSGDLTLNGKISIVPGPAGDLWFYPDWDFSKLNTPFRYELINFKFLDEESVATAFKIDKSQLNTECSFASAKIQISGLRVLIGDTDEAGAYPVKMKVLHVGQYKTPKLGKFEPCK